MENTFELELSTNKILDANKDYLGQVVREATRQVVDGYSDPIKLLVLSKKGQELFSQLEKSVRPYAEQEARLGKGEVYKKFGCEITEKMTGVSYDFTACDDDEWNNLKSKIDDLTSQLKDREKFLKTITKPIFDGNGIEIKPPIHKGRLGLAVTIK
jgi:hypothetical protein